MFKIDALTAPFTSDADSARKTPAIDPGVPELRSSASSQRRLRRFARPNESHSVNPGRDHHPASQPKSVLGDDPFQVFRSHGDGRAPRMPSWHRTCRFAISLSWRGRARGWSRARPRCWSKPRRSARRGRSSWSCRRSSCRRRGWHRCGRVQFRARENIYPAAIKSTSTKHFAVGQ